MHNENLQLFDAGPVKHRPRKHFRGNGNVVAECAEPGCTNMRRPVQGARYCDDHARSKNYAIPATVEAPSETRTCPACSRSFNYRKRPRTEAARIWDDFCPSCHTESPLSLVRLRQHNVPPILISQWLKARSQLKCDGCGKTLTRRHLASRPIIDHDHRCCPGGTSCGGCVRGVLCWACNTKIGHIEAAISAGLLAGLLEYIERKPPAVF